MKKVLVFAVMVTSFYSCNDEIFDIQEVDNVEMPPAGLKLKSKKGLISERFYYHSNGFVDSISSYHLFGGTFADKFIYNNSNQIIEIKAQEQFTNNSSSIKKKFYYFHYNNLNQIISKSTYDENNVLLDSITYTYTSNGVLNNANKTVLNENLISESGGGTLITYIHDTSINPYYNIYPKAYRTINYINKNNTLKQVNVYDNLETIINEHQFELNELNYKVKEFITNMGVDTDDSRTYNYY